MSAPPPTQKDADQVLRYSFDDAEGRIRVDAEITAVVTDLEIRAASGDNIAITNQDGSNPLVINNDGSINTVIDGAVAVEITAASGDNIAISDGTNTLDVNPDGSINVNATIVATSNGTSENIYAEVTGIAIGATTTVATYTVPAGKTFHLTRADISSDSVSVWEVQIDSTTISKRRIYYTRFNDEFEFLNEQDGYALTAGTVIDIVATNNSLNSVAAFNSNIQGVLT